MGFISEFKEFAMRGNVMDMAIGIVIGGAFGKIVSSFVSDLIMPVVGMITGGIDFSEMVFILKDAAIDENGNEIAAVTINYGSFITTVIDFIIIAFAIFMVIKAMNRMKRKEEEAPAEPPKPSKEEVLLTEIRDAIRAK